jgi:hypothetical protein
MADMTPEQKHNIEHALGLGSAKKPYRRHYCTYASDPELEAMVEAGWMVRGNKINDGRDQYYFVTEAGAKAVGHDLPSDD